MLWIDKYAPRYIDQLLCHQNLTEALRNMVAHYDIPHLLFYGPSGGGKKTRIMAILRHLFGPSIDKVKAETISPEGTSTEFVTCSSAFHNQISAPELGTRDRICVQVMIKQLASQVAASTFSFGPDKKIPKFRVFIMQDADALSNEAQAGLRRTLEKYVRNARVILHCQQISAIMPPLRSRCFCIRVPLPSEDEVLSVLSNITKSEQLSCSDQFMRQISVGAKRNLRRAILMLEHAAVTGFPAAETIAEMPWEHACADISKKVVTTQTPKCLLDCREIVYDMLSSCVPGNIILKTVCIHLLRASPDHCKADIARAAAHYSSTLKRGSKEIWHVEAFLAQVMSLVKRAGGWASSSRRT